jgi:selenocysteine-specific elongation factor
VIIATAGHVDHGKTTLIRALTGVDTDRLAEEKRRGLSINLGYAYLPVAGALPLGFIDVPGHRRFINTMIAGISGIDMGLLVVAADDGPMPQTREHLDVLEQLGVPELSVVISKTDRVAERRVDEVRQELEALLREHSWSAPEMFPVDSTQDLGIGALRENLQRRAEQAQARKATGLFRISLDRAFNIKGTGLVVTGTIASGSVQTGDSLRLLDGRRGRVRGLRVHDGDAESAIAGQRCAINLAGNLTAAEINRGTWLLGEDSVAPSQRLDVEFSLVSSAPFPLKHLAPVKLHLGAGRVAGRLALLESSRRKERLQPGTTCLARLLLDEPVAACRQDRFLLRDHAEAVTLGGGRVLDPFAPPERKLDDDRLAVLQALQLPDSGESLAALAAAGGVQDMENVRLTFNLSAQDLQLALPANARTFSASNRKWVVRESAWTDGMHLVQRTVERWLANNPTQAGVPIAMLKNHLGNDIAPPLLLALLTAAVERRDLTLMNGLVSLPGFSATASTAAQASWDKLYVLLQRGGRQIPLITDLSNSMGMASTELETQLVELARLGHLRRISDKRFALPGLLEELAEEVQAMAEAGESLTVIAVKNRFGVGRNLAIEVLEYFDRVRFTRRQGDTRVIQDRGVPAESFTR